MIKVTRNSGTDRGGIKVNTVDNGADLRIAHNIIRGVISGAATGNAGLRFSDYSNVTYKVWNNIIYDFIIEGSGASHYGIFLAGGSGEVVYAYNNTVYNSIYGYFRGGSAGTFIAKNNIYQSNGISGADGYIGTFTSSDYNISVIAGDTTGGSNDKAGISVKFLDAPNNDFHLAQADYEANDQGVDLSADANLAFTDDIDGETRRGQWDIGADQQKKSVSRINVSRTNKWTDGLVGYWTFDAPHTAGTTTFDQSGQGNDGALTNDPTPAIGKIGQGLEFDGGDDYVILENVSILDEDGTNPLTLSAWVKTSSATLPTNMMIHGKLSSSNVGYGMLAQGTVAGDPYRVLISAGAGNAAIVDYSRPSNTEWQHVVFTYDGLQDVSGIRFFIDGVEDISQTIISNNLVSSITNITAFAIANSGAANTEFNGLIDEVRIYNRALRADEITKLYNSGAAAVNVSRNSKITNGLVGLWSFDGPDMAGVTAYDRSGQGNNGTLTNGPEPTIGKLGQAIEFDGSDYVCMGDVLDMGSSNFTLSTWVYKEPSGDGMIMAKYWGTAAQRSFSWQLSSNGSMTFTTSDDGTNVDQFGSSVTISNDTWDHAAIVKAGTTATFYVNGLPGGSGAAKSPLYDNDNFFCIAAQRKTDGTIGSELEAKIDETRVYNRALSVDEVRRLYNMGR